MTTPLLMLATRTMKARGYGRCPSCERVTSPGQLIALHEGRWWHAACFIRAMRGDRDG